MTETRPPRASDRWMTPGVVIVGLLAAVVVVLGITGAVVYLAARGIDPDPVMQLVPALVAAVTGTGAMVLQLVHRGTATRTERNTGTLAPEGVPVDLRAELAEVRSGQEQIGHALWAVADAMPQPVPRHSYEDHYGAGPAEDPHPPTVERRAAPGPRGSC